MAYADKSAESCRQVWVNVILQALRDIAGVWGTDGSQSGQTLAQQQALNWVRSSRHFDVVAELAGLDPVRTRKKILAAVSSPGFALAIRRQGRHRRMVEGEC